MIIVGPFTQNWRGNLFNGPLCFYGSLGITPTQNCTHFLKIGFVVAGGGFYSYYIHKGSKSDKERKIVRKKLSCMHTKRFKHFLKDGCNSTSTCFYTYIDKCLSLNITSPFFTLQPCTCLEPNLSMIFH